ncbi:MAG: LPS assembly protein LptD [Gammaproteobacteria bacterium]|nr:LPS assembly protein LptD [Gammaproteobacteria bacterium]
MKSSTRALIIATLWPALLLAVPDQALQVNDPLCTLDTDSVILHTPPDAFTSEEKDQTRISAQQVENTSGDISIFSGNVLIERDKLRLQADTTVFNRTTQQLEFDGNIHVDAESLSIEADNGWYNIESQTGKFSNSRYQSADAEYRGETPALSLAKGQQTLMINSSFSSCPGENKDWQLNTSLLKLDQETSTGTAKHAVLWFKNIPIFYTPYLSFPLGDERRSGFLMPGFGNSTSGGAELSVPWYWNIAPNQDAVITPRYMNRRGTQLNTHYRYLTQSSNGLVDLEYLPEDKQTQTERYLIKFNNHSDITTNTNLDLTIQDTSDKDYFDDLGAGFTISNTTHLEQKATLRYTQDTWSINTVLQSYETIDDTIALASRPYRRLPQITVTATDTLRDSELLWSLNSELVDFKHESNTKIEGQRIYLYPQLSWPITGTAWFITPTTGIHYSQYKMTDEFSNELDIENRSLSISSLDAGLFFERDIVNNNYLQTFEPRLYYLYAPYEDQSAIPIFDTTETEFGFSQLFRDNRFSGVDRVGDANQLTLALSSRIISQASSAELLNLSIGQIHYFDDRKVSLTNIESTHKKSDIVAEIGARLNHWNAKSTVQWDTQLDQLDKRNITLSYVSPQQEILNLGYRFRRDPADTNNSIEQTDFSFNWPMTNQYSLLGRWSYSVTDKQDIDSLFGIEYESCCWALRVVAQRYLNIDATPDEDEYDTSIMFQLVLKGLGSVSEKSTTNILKQAIPGYSPEY